MGNGKRDGVLKNNSGDYSVLFGQISVIPLTPRELGDMALR